MGYYITVVVCNKDGRPVKAEITCGGKYRGFTNENNGELSFEMQYEGEYSISAKTMFSQASGTVRTGQRKVLHFTN
jgi:hypothetical protein